MTLRASFFWLKDFLLGKGRVRSAYEEIKAGLETGEENIKQRNKLLEWAKQDVPFYKDLKDIEFYQLPVVNKTIIRNGGEKFVADSWKYKSLHKEMTSGSTGAPFTILQDPGKRVRASADSIFFSEFAGFNLGTRLYYVRIWNHLNKKSKLQTVIQNVVMQPSDNLSDESLENFICRLEEDDDEKSVLAYASSITALFEYMYRTGRKTTAKVSCFITMSETFPDNARRGIKDLFKCPVISRYSNQECGLMSQQCKDSMEYHVNTASFYVEILDLNKDIPVKDGCLGRIVVTDLFNFAMPLIRYDTGDLGVISHKCECGLHGKVLTKVEGRRIDFITATNGDLLSPVTVINAMWEYRDLKQWQFIQHNDNTYEMKLNSQTPVYNREEDMLSDIKAYIGREANIRVTYVSEIPTLASGKRKSVINMNNVK